MSLIRPFAGLRPLAQYAAEVIAPPYDVLNTEEARLQAKDKPKNFLHISKPEIDLPVGTDPYSEAVYAQGAAHLQHLRQQGVLQQDSQPSYYLYQLIMGEHEQTGIVALANIADYETNRIRKHELTRPDKEDDRVRHIEALNAQTGPVFLTYRQDSVIDTLVDRLTAQAPEVDVQAVDGVKHRLWTVTDSAHIDTITTTFDAMSCLYIADGHHRSAAAARVAASRQTESAQYFLSVIFPDNQMQILDYNRVVQDLNGLSVTEFLAHIERHFQVHPQPQAYKPQKSGEMGLFVAGQWYQLILPAEKIPQHDPVAQLDVSLLTNYILTPILGITDLRRDKRIDFVGGIRGLAALEQRVTRGEMACAFALYPTRLAALMAVADANQVMPPKSTWFEPKLADGLISHVL